MQGFAHYVNGLALNLNADRDFQFHKDHDRAISVTASSFQSAVRSVTFYPFAVVIERNDAPEHELTAYEAGHELATIPQRPISVSDAFKLAECTNLHLHDEH